MEETRTIERNGRRWWIRPAAEPLLDQGWPLDQADRLTVVKHGFGRTVSRLRATDPAAAGGEADYFVKTYHASDLVRRLRAWLGLGPGRSEWHALVAACEAGLDVPQPVALACGANEILVTRAIAGSRRLDEYLFERYFEPRPGDPPYPGARPPDLVSLYRRRRRPPEGTIDPRSLARALADLVAGMARAGFFLPDLHPGNVLISGGPGAWRLSLVDLAQIEWPASPDEVVMESLFRLEHFFEPIASVSERLRCLAHLRQVLGAGPDARVVAHATAVYRQSFYRQRDRRTRRESKYFRRISGGDWRGWAAADWADAVQQLLARASGPPSGQLIKEGRTSTVWRLTLDDGRSLIAKRHHRAGDRPLVASRSLATFRKGHALLARGIATARPAAAADLRRHGAVHDTLVLTEPIEGAEPLSAWLRREPPAAQRRRVTRNLALMLRRLHAAGFSHRDLKAPNILIAGTDADGPRPVLVDLDGLRLGRWVSPRRRAQNLMRLSVSLDEWGVARQTDRLRFLRAYLGRRGCPAPITILHRCCGSTAPARRLRRWWQRIARQSRRKIEMLRRKGPLPVSP